MSDVAETRPLAGRHVLVTGASRGIGASTAALLAQAGATLAIAARSEADLARVAAACDEQGGVAIPVIADLADPVQVERLFRELDERLGPLDALINNAALLRAGPLHAQPREAWEPMLALNLAGLIGVTQAALTRMRARGEGLIVNVASVAGVPGVPKLPGTVVYAASKAAVIGFSEALAAEEAASGVRVVCVSPGSTQTAMLAQVVSPEEHAAAPRPAAVGRVLRDLLIEPPPSGAHLVLRGDEPK